MQILSESTFEIRHSTFITRLSNFCLVNLKQGYLYFVLRQNCRFGDIW